MDYQTILAEIEAEVQPFRAVGEIATYIPELAKVDPDQFGVHLICMDAGHFSLGDSEVRFSIQSISKVLAVTYAFQKVGLGIWDRCNREPSGTAFNSLIQLELEKGIPRNPFINAGALVMTDIVLENCEDPKKEFLNFVRELAGESSINYNPLIVASEKKTGYRNAALCNLIKSFGNIRGEVEEVLDLYYHFCSIEMTCHELASTFLFQANGGKDFPSGKEILTRSQSKRLNALMQTCGFYDEAGDFSFKVGLPGKSGVGGGIIAVHPGHYSVAVWSPRLNPKGNSVLGMQVLERLTTKTGASIF
jgi:glutaminase